LARKDCDETDEMKDETQYRFALCKNITPSNEAVFEAFLL
jgi:hypothetical protein